MSAITRPADYTRPAPLPTHRFEVVDVATGEAALSAKTRASCQINAQSRRTSERRTFAVREIATGRVVDTYEPKAAVVDADLVTVTR